MTESARTIVGTLTIVAMILPFFPQVALADISVVSATLDGGSSTTVAPSDSVEVELTVDRQPNNPGSENDWESTFVDIIPDGLPGQCIDTGVHDFGASVDTENFNITAPSAVGSYDVSIKIYRQPNCVSEQDNITLDDGIIVEEEPTGLIRIFKEANPEDGTNFSFSGSLGVFELDDDGGVAEVDDDDDGLTNQYVADGLTAGEYTITEDELAGWELESITCNIDDEQVDLENRSVTFDLDDDERVGCTFFNTKEEEEESDGTLRICKVVVDSEGELIDPSTLDPSTLDDTAFRVTATDDDDFYFGVAWFTPFELSTDLFGDADLDGNCAEYPVPYGTYYYSEEDIQGDNVGDWETPLYNEPEIDSNFHLYGTNEANGDVIVSENTPDRTIIIKNTLKEGVGGGGEGLLVHKWNDINGNGEQDAGDGSGEVRNYTFNLYDSSWNLKATGSTGAPPQPVNFPSAESTDYVCEVLKEHWVQTYPDAQTGVANQSGEVHEAAYCLPVGDADELYFGNYYKNRIEGYKWHDIDRNQRREGGPLLDGWTFRLYEIGDEGWGYVDEQVSGSWNDKTGWFLFHDLEVATYAVCEVTQPGWVVTRPTGNQADDILNESGALDESEYCHFVTFDQPGSGFYRGVFGNDLEGEQNICEPGVELIENGSFEEPVVTHNAGWDVFPSGTTGLAWLVEWVSGIVGPNPALLEFHAGVNSWNPDDGEQYAELDGDTEGPDGSTNGEEASTRISQIIPTVPGETYAVSFAFSPRPGEDENENVLKVFWNGSEEDEVSADGTSNGNTHWETYTYAFEADSWSTELAFEDAGVSNSLGTFIDNVSVMCQEPAPLPECSDGLDNDDDEYIDEEDPGCHTDGNPNNPESYDPEDNDEYNRPPKVVYGDYCGDGEINQEWEQCDLEEGCTEQCQWEDNNQCTDLVLARVVVENVNNFKPEFPNGNATSDIFLGNDGVANRIPSGTWFPVFSGGSYVTDPINMELFEDVPGLAVRRREGDIRTRLHGSHTVTENRLYGKEHVDGYVEFWSWDDSVEPTAMASQLNQNKTEKPFNGTKDYNPNNDELDTDFTDGEASFWLTVGSADDGFITDYSAAPVCEECEEGSVWATSVIEKGTKQGTRNNGGDIATERSNPEDTLGEPDGVGSPAGGFFSLGVGGVLTVKFDHFIEDVDDSVDLSFHEITNGRNNYPEENAFVEVSQDGETWYDVGTVSSLEAVDYLDFSSTGLPWIMYVRLTDTTDYESHSGDADGYDVDAIDATNGLCEEPQVPPPGDGDGDGDGDGSITIVKSAATFDGVRDGTDFTFNDFGEGTFNLDDANPDDEDGIGSSITFSDLPAGLYDFSEVLPANGWFLQNIECSGDLDQGSDISILDREVTIDLDAGEDITCTFTNTTDAPSFSGGGGRSTPNTSGGDGDGDGDVEGEVAGASITACSPYLNSFLHQNQNNDAWEMTKLRLFLNTFLGLNLPTSGPFNASVFSAVQQFQSKYSGDVLGPWGLANPTGYVYLTTRNLINRLMCPTVAVPTPYPLKPDSRV